MFTEKSYHKIDMFTMKKCIDCIVKHVGSTRKWNPEEYYAKFSSIEHRQCDENNSTTSFALFNIVNIQCRNEFIAEMRKPNARLSFGRLPEEFFVEINIDTFSIIKES